MYTNILSAKRKSPAFMQGFFKIYFVLLASNSASAPNGNGIHQKSFNSLK